MTACAAVIVTYRTPPASLQRCLDSLKDNGLASQNIIIRDNNQHNIGFAAGVNDAARSATADFLLFLNPDAALNTGALAQARRYLVSHPRCGAAGLLLISPAGTPEKFSFGPPVTPRSLFTRHLFKSPPPQQPAAVGWVSGGALLVRRSLFQRLNGFDPRFFLYWEDVDLCRRIRQAGFKVVLLPQATAIHSRGASLNDQKLKTRLFDQSADKYFRKYYPESICLSLRLARSCYRLFSPQAY